MQDCPRLGAGRDGGFKLVKLVVNSAASEYNNDTSQERAVCDTTPTRPSQTCTLAAAIEVSNKLGGGTISFDIPGPDVPTITPELGHELPEIKAPLVLDGTSEAGSHIVALTSATGRFGLLIRSPGVTVRGMRIYGFPLDLGLEHAGRYRARRTRDAGKQRDHQ